MGETASCWNLLNGLAHPVPALGRQLARRQKRCPILATRRRSIHLDHDSYAMRLAVRHIESAIAVDEDAVRPRQRALKRIGLGTVTSLTGADDCCDGAGVECDAAYHVALSVGQ